jgi:plasmid stabilization system protein ParE
MIRQLRFRGAARADLRRAKGWYEREAPHMVDAFLEEFRAVVSSIEERPLMYPAIAGEVRRALMTRFSYAIYFRRGNDHGLRDPSPGASFGHRLTPFEERKKSLASVVVHAFREEIPPMRLDCLIKGHRRHHRSVTNGLQFRVTGIFCSLQLDKTVL